jgi:alkaline phosphatase D
MGLAEEGTCGLDGTIQGAGHGNGLARQAEKDDWQTYAHERDALFRFIGDKGITGVVLLGGDVHVSLRLDHPTAKTVGYSLPEYVVSPLHDRVLPALVPTGDPLLQWSAAEPNVFLRMEADSTGDQPRLTSTWIRMDGKRLREHVLVAGE